MSSGDDDSSNSSLAVKIVDDDMDLRRVDVDCSSLFEVVDEEDSVQELRLLRDQRTKILDLSPLDVLRHEAEDSASAFEFLPQKIYVRDTMQEMFNLITKQNDPRRYCIIFGSPGVGKSVLTFLAALCCAAFGPVTSRKYGVLYLRKTDSPVEDISAFWIRPKENADGSNISTGCVTIDFHRTISNDTSLAIVHKAMRSHIFRDEENKRNKIRMFKNHIRSICDGPHHKSDDHVGPSDLVTSGGYAPPKDEEWEFVVGMPVSSWKVEDVIDACKNLFHQTDSDTAKEWFDVCGGNIRRITSLFNGTLTIEQCRDRYVEIIRQEAGNDALELALHSTQLSKDEKSIDRLRAMFAYKTQTGSFTTIQFIGSPFILRLVRSRLSLETTQRGLSYAQESGVGSLHGWHFEIFGHKIFDEFERLLKAAVPENPRRGPNCHDFTSVPGKGSGKESVEQLAEQNVYWTPSISHFSNFDAAIAINGTLYCIQYTVGTTHNFNYNTFLSDFWENLDKRFQGIIKDIKVVFVVPERVSFLEITLQPKDRSKQLSFEYSCVEGIRVSNAKVDSDTATMEVEEDGKAIQETYSNDQDGNQSSNTLSCDYSSEQKVPKVQKINAPPIHFQWEQLSDTINPDVHPLSFMR
mmetsp:Transcript_57843/g.141318  ORF Transcript_57843/g.141318 Transcript_57843/m.141318 type:complete len:636 (+) Transcript_57843:106-2013(+)